MAKKNWKLSQKYICYVNLDKFKWLSSSEQLIKNIAIKKLNIAVKHLDLCFLTSLVKSRYLEVLLQKSELNYIACYLKNKVFAHRLGLVIQLSWRVAPPCSKYHSMSFYDALNTFSMGFLVALITHSMNLFVALKRDFQCELHDLWTFHKPNF